MRIDREAQGNTEGPWERQVALGWGIPMLFLGRQGLWGWGNSYAILGNDEELIK